MCKSSGIPAGNGSVMTGLGKASPRPSLQMSSVQPMYSTPNQPFEDVLLRQRTLGQDIIPSPYQPKRTESLYTPQKPMPNTAGAAASSATGGGGGGFFGGKSGKLKVCLKLIYLSKCIIFGFSSMLLLLLSSIHFHCVFIFIWNKFLRVFYFLYLFFWYLGVDNLTH